jgi:hypothetical protein
MDGVLCRPIVWFNLVISRDVRRPLDLSVTASPSANGLPHRLIDTQVGQALRYDWRPPMPLVREGLASLADVRDLVLLSGRPGASRSATERWLRRHGLRDYFSEIVLNDRGVSNASFKLLTSRERDVREHVDDDGRVAFFLARDNGQTVYLISWGRNANLPYPASVRRVRHLVDAAKAIRAADASVP